MRTDKIKAMLGSGEYTCVLCKDEDIYTSNERGVKPLLSWLEEGVNLQGFYAADKVVGKGAAFLYVLLGVKEVYARVMSVPAKKVLEAYNIKTEYDELAQAIVNRAGTGFCPIETALKDMKEPTEALQTIKIKLAQMESKRL